MKFSLKAKALLSLLATVILWSVHAIISRTVVQEISPMVLSLLRMGTAALLFLPFILRDRPWRNPQFTKLVGVSLLSGVNVLFFILGIRYTTASTSQLIYAAIPIMIVLVNIFLLKEKVSWGKIAGVLLGFAGLVYIVYLSAVEKVMTIAGGLNGNLMIVVAQFGWLSYILLSKKMSKYFTPIEIGGISIIVTFLVNIPLAIIELLFAHPIIILNLRTISGAFYMGAFGTFLAYIFYQYAIKNVSTLTVSLASYIQPITTAILASVLIGEKLTVHFIFGSILVFAGIFLTTTLELYKRRG